MRPASLTLLAVVTAAAIAVAVSLNAVRGSGGADAARGELFVPGLVDRINDVQRVEIEDRAGRTILRREGEGFVDDSGFPANQAIVRDLLTNLSVLSIEEAKTDRPDRYAELNLAEPSAKEGAARRVRVLAGDQMLADVLVGKTESSVGGTRGGLYARREGEARSWLLRGAVELPGARAGWFDNRLLELKSDQLQSLTLDDGTARARLYRPEGARELALQDVPDGRSADASKVGQLAGTLGSLRFADLRKSGPGSGAGGGPVLTAVTRDGMTVRLIQTEHNADAKSRWVRLEVSGSTNSDAAKVAELERRFKGFEFELRGVSAEMLGSKADSFLALP
ncbi:MAG: DUF4340 domain-containing protein [Burkholderiaceae bacterium]